MIPTQYHSHEATGRGQLPFRLQNSITGLLHDGEFGPTNYFVMPKKAQANLNSHTFEYESTKGLIPGPEFFTCSHANCTADTIPFGILQNSL